MLPAFLARGHWFGGKFMGCFGVWCFASMGCRVVVLCLLVIASLYSQSEAFECPHHTPYVTNLDPEGRLIGSVFFGGGGGGGGGGGRAADR